MWQGGQTIGQTAESTTSRPVVAPTVAPTPTMRGSKSAVVTHAPPSHSVCVTPSMSVSLSHSICHITLVQHSALPCRLSRSMHCITQSALKLSSPSICHPIKSFISLRQTHLSHFTPPVSHWPLCSVCLTQLWQWLQAVGRTNNPRRLFKEEWRRLYPLAQYCAKQMGQVGQVHTTM